MRTTTLLAPLRLGTPPINKDCVESYRAGPASWCSSPSIAVPNFAQSPCCIAFRASSSRVLACSKAGCRVGGCDDPSRGCCVPKKVVERLVKRGLHHNLVARNRDDALQLRKVRAFGGQIYRHDVQEGVLDRSHDQFPANHSRPFLVPEGELLGNGGVLVDHR